MLTISNLINMNLTKTAIKKLISEELQKISEGDVIDMQDYRSKKSVPELFTKAQDKIDEIETSLYEIANKLAELSFMIDELYDQGDITAEQAGQASLAVSKLQRGWRATMPDMIEKLLSI